MSGRNIEACASFGEGKANEALEPLLRRRHPARQYVDIIPESDACRREVMFTQVINVKD
jgi:hypothetical protein